jgi:hypothetical protein
LTCEQRQLGSAPIARDHQGPARIVGPLSILAHWFQAQNLPVPGGGFLPVGNKQLDVIDRHAI